MNESINSFADHFQKTVVFVRTNSQCLFQSTVVFRSFLRRIVSVKNANLGITNLPEFVILFTICTSTFQLVISWFHKNKREIGNLAGKAILVLASSGPESFRRLRSPDFKTIGI